MVKMVDLKRSKADKKAEKEKYSSGTIGGEDYPYGTRVSLNHEELEKLGMDSLPKVGSKMKLHGIAHVVSTSDDDSEGSGKRRSVSLHIKKMGLEPHADSESDVDEGALDAMDEALSSKGKKK